MSMQNNIGPEDASLLLDKDEYIDSLRKELLYLIEKKLTPLALKYNYSAVPLESKIKWKSTVLILGNYSSGKSTLINELIGAKVQATGQAPTDDCFTIITCDDDETSLSRFAEGAVYEERDGSVLLNDEKYPFEILRKYGDKFAAHFRLKKVRSRALRNLVIIDTPGMLDSANERERGYDYQGVIGDLAMLSDLVLVLFDPHKAGTIRESHFSLRETLPEKTFEDRLIFVLNRVDECTNLDDLLRVYGTLCWNLSAMTGRKDIPKILLTYATSKAQLDDIEKPFLDLVKNQRQELTRTIFQAPHYRLDHLASFLEFHSRRLCHFLEEVIKNKKAKRKFFLHYSLVGLLTTCFIGLLGLGYVYIAKPQALAHFSSENFAVGFAATTLSLYLAWHFIILRWLLKRKNSQLVHDLKELHDLERADRNETWNHIKPKLIQYLESHNSKPSLTTLKEELSLIEGVHNKGAKEIRTAMNRIGDFFIGF